MKKPVKITLITLAVLCAISAPFAIYTMRKRSNLYEGLPYMLIGYKDYDSFTNSFYNRNIKNKNEKAFILKLNDDLGEPFGFLALGLHDCGKHMLWCKKSAPFHYLRNTFYRQLFVLETNDYTTSCYIFYQQYYELDNPNLEWIEVDAFYEIPPTILGSSPDLDTIFYELYDTTQERSVLKVEFSFDEKHKNSEVIEDVKNKLLSKFTETYL